MDSENKGHIKGFTSVSKIAKDYLEWTGTMLGGNYVDCRQSAAKQKKVPANRSRKVSHAKKNLDDYAGPRRWAPVHRK